MNLDLRELLGYALFAAVPEGFARRLLDQRQAWDPEFERRLNDLAYELRPDLAVWELTVLENGCLVERLLPILPDR